MKKVFATGAALLLAAAVAGMLPGAGRRVHAATTTVSVQDNQYSPSSITINVGDTVQWNWTGSNPHTVSSTGAESFDSGAPQTGGSFSHMFNTIGSFGYACAVHGSAMAGTVVVQAAPATNTPTSTPTATNTPAATNTPVTSTTTPGASQTPAPTNTPAPSITAAATTPTIDGTLPATAATRPSDGAGAGAALPRTGTGGTSSGFAMSWFAIAIAAAGLTAIGGAAALRKRA